MWLVRKGTPVICLKLGDDVHLQASYHTKAKTTADIRFEREDVVIRHDLHSSQLSQPEAGSRSFLTGAFWYLQDDMKEAWRAKGFSCFVRGSSTERNIYLLFVHKDNVETC